MKVEPPLAHPPRSLTLATPEELMVRRSKPVAPERTVPRPAARSVAVGPAKRWCSTPAAGVNAGTTRLTRRVSGCCAAANRGSSMKTTRRVAWV